MELQIKDNILEHFSNLTEEEQEKFIYLTYVILEFQKKYNCHILNNEKEYIIATNLGNGIIPKKYQYLISHIYNYNYDLYIEFYKYINHTTKIIEKPQILNIINIDFINDELIKLLNHIIIINLINKIILSINNIENLYEIFLKLSKIDKEMIQYLNLTYIENLIITRNMINNPYSNLTNINNLNNNEELKLNKINTDINYIIKFIFNYLNNIETIEYIYNYYDDIYNIFKLKDK